MSDFLTRHAVLVVATICVVGLGVRVAGAVWWQARLPAGQQFAFADSDSYWQLARTIVEGRTYEYIDETQRVHRTPGYPILLAGLFWTAGGETSVLAARMLGAVLGTATIAAAAALAWRLFDERAAVVAALLVAFDPAQIGASVFVLAEGPFTLAMAGQMLLWTEADRSDEFPRRAGFALATGLMAGVAILLRPSWLLFTPVASVVAIAVSSERARQVTIAAMLAVGLIIPLVPWWIRNAQVTGEFVPTTLQVGASLYDGLNARATGASEMSFVPAFREEQRDHDRQHPDAPGVFEARLDRRLRDAALDWAAANPGDVLRLAGVKFLRIWSPWPNESELRSPLMIAVTAGAYLPILILGLWGAWKFASRGIPYLLCILPAGYFTLLHVIFVASIRYRQPAMVLLAVLAAGVIITWLNTDTEAPSPDHSPLTH